MRTVAGTSAVAGYRAARAQRRRAAAISSTLLAAAAAAGWATRLVAGTARVALAAATAACLLVAYLARPRPDAERWLRGAAGEVATAARLDRLPARRWTVRHDLLIPGSRANVDHLVIGPTGVWVIDTKTTRAPARAGWRTVRLGDRTLDSGPVRWEAAVIADRLDTDIRLLIVVHGGGLRRRGGRAGGVRVLPVDRLLRHLRRGRRRLGRTQVAELTDRMDEVFFPEKEDAHDG
jgi:hypothetical protein